MATNLVPSADDAMEVHGSRGALVTFQVTPESAEE
jgi:hypothetical protein